MSYSTSAHAYTLHATNTASPNGFSIFSFSHSPRESHAMYEDLRGVLRSSNRDDAEFGVIGKRTLRRASSVPSLKDSLRKMFGF